MLTKGQINERQHGIIATDINNMSCIIAGAGMVGGWAALALARLFDSVEVWDFDIVGVENVGCQPYGERDIDRPKVEALSSNTQVSGLSLRGVPAAFPPEDWDAEPAHVFISAVDTMEGRRKNALWAQENKVPLYLDSRVLGELVCLAAVDNGEYDRYLEDLPTDGEVPDAPCGSRGTAYVGMWTAARIAADINTWGHGGKLPRMRSWHIGTDTTLNDGREDS
jgi:hypothetical protein